MSNKQQCLKAHNELRKEHGCPPLKWSSDLTEHAQLWAEKLAEKGRTLYAEIPGVGENIAILTHNGLANGVQSNAEIDQSISQADHQHPSIEIDADQVVKLWSQERDLYDFEKGGWQRRAHNFTQMIWKSTTELGVGKATTKDGKTTFVVAFYKPTGNSNKEGDFSKNVPKRVEV